MTYYLIGSGNMAWFLMAKMQGAGHTCSGIKGRNKKEVEALAAAYNVPIIYDTLFDGPDACLLAVADNAIAEVTKDLAFRSTVLIHHSGSTNIEILKHSLHNGVVWPVYSILKKDQPQHRNIPCVCEYNDTIAEKVVTEVVAAITAMRYYATSEQRRWMHLMAVIGNNFTNYLLGICADICKEQNIPFNLLQPILQQTLDRATYHHPKEMQTGPAKRGDSIIQIEHLNMMHLHPDWQKIYTSLSEAINNTYNSSQN